MSAVAIAIIDPFPPKIIETLSAVLPAGWTLRISDGRSLDQQAPLRADDLAFVMAPPMPATRCRRRSATTTVIGVRIDGSGCVEQFNALREL